MSDDHRNSGRPGRDCININEVYELPYRSDELGVTKEELAVYVEELIGQ